MYKYGAFNGLEFNPFVGEDVTMVSVYPKLARRKLFTELPDFEEMKGYKIGAFATINQPKEEDLNKMLIFVALFVEPMGNPLANEKDFSFRRSQAMELAGIEPGSNLGRIIEEEHPWCAAMVSEYFKVTQNLDYEAWFSYKMQFHRRAAAIRDNLDLSKSDLDLESLKRMILKYEMALFPDERVKKMVEEDATATQIIRWAERFARNYSQ